MTPTTGDGDPPSPTKSSLTQRFFSSIGNKIKGFLMRRKPGFMGRISMYLVERLLAFTRKLTQHSVPSSKPQEVCSFIYQHLSLARLICIGHQKSSDRGRLQEKCGFLGQTEQSQWLCQPTQRLVSPRSGEESCPTKERPEESSKQPGSDHYTHPASPLSTGSLLWYD